MTACRQSPATILLDEVLVDADSLEGGIDFLEKFKPLKRRLFVLVGDDVGLDSSVHLVDQLFGYILILKCIIQILTVFGVLLFWELVDHLCSQ